MTNENITLDVSGSYNNETFNKYNVIDGIFGNCNNSNQCKCCFATDNKTHHGWLQLDLQRTFLVYRINVFGRCDGQYPKRQILVLSISNTLYITIRNLEFSD